MPTPSWCLRTSTTTNTAKAQGSISSERPLVPRLPLLLPVPLALCRPCYAQPPDQCCCNAAPLGRQHRGKTRVTAGRHGVEHTNAAAKVLGKVTTHVSTDVVMCCCRTVKEVVRLAPISAHLCLVDSSGRCCPGVLHTLTSLRVVQMADRVTRGGGVRKSKAAEGAATAVHEHFSHPNVLVAHLQEGLEVIHLYTGASVF